MVQWVLVAILAIGLGIVELVALYKRRFYKEREAEGKGTALSNFIDQRVCVVTIRPTSDVDGVAGDGWSGDQRHTLDDADEGEEHRVPTLARRVGKREQDEQPGQQQASDHEVGPAPAIREARPSDANAPHAFPITSTNTNWVKLKCSSPMILVETAPCT